MLREIALTYSEAPMTTETNQGTVKFSYVDGRACEIFLCCLSTIILSSHEKLKSQNSRYKYVWDSNKKWIPIDTFTG